MERLITHTRRQIAAQRLARSLAGASDIAQVGALAMDALARVVRARIGSLAVRESAGDRLEIVATLGYPLALVKHLRLSPGEGVIGSVYTSGVPLRVSDVNMLPCVTQRRPRYSTTSCMAWPLTVGPDVLGILCTSDRHDGQPFTPDDMASLRALSAPITLAVSRECARSTAGALAQAAAIDPLSGLFNRRYFEHRLAEELERAQRHAMPVALAMIDLDGFKKINDIQGHLQGDAVIREIADMVRHAVRVFDVCTRFGGDEFAVVMPGTSDEDAIRISDRIRERIAVERLGKESGLRLTASVGVATAVAGMAPRELIARADRCLYRAKRSGGNRVCLCGAEE